MFVINFTIGLVCIIAVRLGIETIGRTSAYFIVLVFIVLIMVQILVLPSGAFRLYKANNAQWHNACDRSRVFCLHFLPRQ